MKYDLYDLLNEAIMVNKAMILVEGKDDKQIYDHIAEAIPKEVDIYPINYIEEYASGCDNVIKAMQKLQPKFGERKDNVKFILGIIDGDSRPYRILQEYEIDYTKLIGLYVLKHYSIETYFATENNIAALIQKLTYLPKKMIDNDLIKFTNQKFEGERKNGLYWLSLEALHKACDEKYNNIIGYKDDKIKDFSEFVKHCKQIESKKVALKQFADVHNLDESALKQICKGKWYLFHYASAAFEQIKNMEKLCGNLLKQCDACKTQNKQDCNYKIKKGYQVEALYNEMQTFIDKDSCKDIIEQMQKLC